MAYDPGKPLIVLNDCTVLLDPNHERFEQVRCSLARFADLLKCPETGLHTYRIQPLSLWNAAYAGEGGYELLPFLAEHAKFGVPRTAEERIRGWLERSDKLQLVEHEGKLVLETSEEGILDLLFREKAFPAMCGERIDECRVFVKPVYRGQLKQNLASLGYPVRDRGGYQQGETLDLIMDESVLRDYQLNAVESFYGQGRFDAGAGVLILPCGAGKTLIGIAAMARLRCATLILTPNVTSVSQWRRELFKYTNADEALVGEYDGAHKDVKPITIATYQILTHRRSKTDERCHMRLFSEREWGLVIYDEVHLLPAPVFRATADIAATRRLGLTATLVREDGRETDVFSLVGPKRFDLPWKRMEREGWIAEAVCREIRVGMSQETEREYWAAENKQKARLAGENDAKLSLLPQLLCNHSGKSALVIGQYLSQLRAASELTGAPMICGETPHDERERLYALFRRGEIKTLIVSKVANFAVDLPDAAVAIELSGAFGSRQEEAQRLGRILRPKAGDNAAYFYTIVSRDTVETDYAANRQRYLIEQGYQYEIADWNDPDIRKNDESGGVGACQVMRDI